MTTVEARSGEVTAGTASWAVKAWLVVVALLVFAMVIVGGATRLTDSGLSITEWQPILGVIPPLSEADWQVALEKYRQIPEYQQVNKGMSLEAFKAIFWWEWAHRFLGRFIGLAFALPLAVFWWRGMLPGWLAWRGLAILALGALQGFVGWYMVMSGLVDRVDVSHYRLALHLTIAFVILAALVWTILDLEQRVAPRIQSWAAVIVGVILLQVVLGAFVAGTKAGLSYNTWPLMDGAFVPDGMWSMSPWWINPLENLAQIQFNHRVLAYVILAISVWQVVRLWGCPDWASAGWVLAAVIGQIGLGIWTLLAAQGAIPIGLGIKHQAFAAVVLALAVWHLHAASRRPQ
ncbi:MAG: hypothetical protein RLZ98_2936 [Pseudomonadota bacterium]|jgi:cytochrome c oxidase assembly protein subunit 15